MNRNFYLSGTHLLKALFRLVIGLLRAIQVQQFPRAACVTQNIFCRLIGSEARFGYCFDAQLYYAVKKCETDVRHFFADQGRGFDIYQRGLGKRFDEVGHSYFCHLVPFSSGDVVVDCGANYGDLYKFCSAQGPTITYVGVEPGPDEFRSLRKNVPNDHIRQVALSDKSGVARFYLSSGSADSSLIEPAASSGSIEVQMVTLSELFEQLGIKRCRLLKLEAEGFEPEIIYGAREVLDQIDYVAFDGGPERGHSEEKTFATVANFLSENGFELVDIFGPQYRALLRRVPTAAD